MVSEESELRNMTKATKEGAFESKKSDKSEVTGAVEMNSSFTSQERKID